ncbi:MAG: hypothetical protein EAZ12_05005 [Sphingobacteriia bacterium]|nr:MAG: hypothetical protein EAZ12_05005 [Sphingobacteriia bacterium]
MKKKLLVAVISFLLIFTAIRFQGAPLKTAITPGGILNLEFANSPAKLMEVLNAWDLSIAKQNIWIDFLFIPSYVLLFSMIAAICSNKWQNMLLFRTGTLLAKAAFAAGILDIAENLLMLQSIAGNYTPSSLWLTYYCAGVKFFILLIIGLYIILSIPVLFKNKES